MPAARQEELPTSWQKTAPIALRRPLHLLRRAFCPQLSRGLWGQRPWGASCPRSGQNFSKDISISSIPCCPGCARSWRRSMGPGGGRQRVQRAPSCTPCASTVRMGRPCSGRCRATSRNIQHHWSTVSSVSSCASAARRPGGCCAAPLPGRRRTALQPAPAPPAPGGGLPPRTRPPPAALQPPTGRRKPACWRLPSAGVPAAPHVHPSLQSRSSPRRSWGRQRRQVPLPRAAATAPLLLAGAGTVHLGGPGAPQRGGPPDPRILTSPARGRPAGGASRPPATPE